MAHRAELLVQDLLGAEDIVADLVEREGFEAAWRAAILEVLAADVGDRVVTQLVARVFHRLPGGQPLLPALAPDRDIPGATEPKVVEPGNALPELVRRSVIERQGDGALDIVGPGTGIVSHVVLIG